MNKLYSYLRTFAVGAVASLATLPALAQAPDNGLAMIVVPHSQDITYRERTLCYNIDAKVDYTVTADQSWVTLRKDGNSLWVHVQPNYDCFSRTATITFSNESENINETLTLTQGPDQSIMDLPDNSIKPTSATANTTEGSQSISLTYDGDTGTLWHSRYSGSKFNVSESNPAILTYSFSGVDRIDYINYVPRQDGNTNGSFTNVSVYVQCEGDEDYTLYASYEWKGDNNIKTIEFENGLLNPVSIQFRVTGGAGGYASCAEMQFSKETTESEYNIFADDLYTTLKPDVTAEDVLKLQDPFVKSLAVKLLNNEYETNYRVASYPCHLSPQTQSEQWAAPGKYYDQIAGVTGINIPANSKQAVVVRGIPDDMQVQLKIVAWYVGRVGGNFDGGDPHTSTYVLRNGLNVIDYNYGYDGLAYICYYSTDDPSNHPDIRAHFVNGQINGYLSPDKTNEEMHELCVNSPSLFMDLVGDKVHAIWTAHGIVDEANGVNYPGGLAEYCKASDGTSLGYIQYINLLDSLVAWEHRLLGFEKYNRLPDNRTMAYVNFTYYMFQGNFGVSFHVDQESRVLNCERLMYHDSDAIWGLSHEWGHQHQMAPYFNWAGQGECTNNMNSCYNVLHMGYSPSEIARIPNAWNNAYAHFFENKRTDLGAPTARQTAYQNIGSFSWNSAVQDEIRRQYEEYNQFASIPSYEDDPDHGVSISEVGVEEQLAPFFMLYCYFTNPDHEGYYADFQQDMYEALRQNDYENGSSIEPDYENGVKKAKTTVDKYELLARAQNNNKNNAYTEFTQAYPNSCWTTQKYITASSGQNQNSVPFIFNYVRKASKICGYNLYNYFERFGFFRTVILRIGDYGNKDYVMMKDMQEEFKADMEALGLKEMSDEMINAIADSPIPTFPRPNIPNTPTVR